MFNNSNDYYTKYHTNCDSDVLHVYVDYAEISEEDLKRLKELVFVPDKYSGYMVSYHYCSNRFVIMGPVVDNLNY